MSLAMSISDLNPCLSLQIILRISTSLTSLHILLKARMYCSIKVAEVCQELREDLLQSDYYTSIMGTLFDEWQHKETPSRLALSADITRFRKRII